MNKDKANLCLHSLEGLSNIYCNSLIANWVPSGTTGLGGLALTTPPAGLNLFLKKILSV
ncbi:Hypothetical protein P9303_03551 [Prochlorococcus marinus str. MIT 9303]|uniref:Uncharacterized protein n=1 Tax=Prochlorococcus marinus (strain MIT 9303) TaxID=59922 RepID=A2C6J7_PROM3|nr:Hypothetical protein P9303_03551 [Prochlorococcus marinus str. MIT 9303]